MALSPSIEPKRALRRLFKSALVAGVLLGGLLIFVVPEPRARAYPQRIPVRFWHMWTGEWKGVIDRIVDRFNKSQDRYEVVALSVPGNGADSKFLLAVAGGDPPDLMAQWNPVIPSWADSGLLVPIDELMSAAERERFDREAFPAVRKLGSYKGRLYGVTVGINISALYYRPEHFRQAGLDPDRFPATLEEVAATGQKLNKYDSAGNLTRLGYLPANFRFYAPVFGGGFYDWKAGSVALDTPANLRCLSFMTDCSSRLGFDKLQRFQSAIVTGGMMADWPFVNGSYSIALDGQWRVEEIARYAPQMEYRVIPVPPPAGGRVHAGNVTGNFMIVPRGAQQKQGAFEFIKFWSGIDQPERAAEFYVWGAWLPLSPAIANAPVYREYLRKYPQFQTFLDILPSDNLQPAPPVPYQMLLMDRVDAAEETSIRGSLTPQQALQRVQSEVDKERGRRKDFGYQE